MDKSDDVVIEKQKYIISIAGEKYEISESDYKFMQEYLKDKFIQKYFKEYKDDKDRMPPVGGKDG